MALRKGISEHWKGFDERLAEAHLSSMVVKSNTQLPVLFRSVLPPSIPLLRSSAILGKP
jgi:hypothetical protein